MFEFDVKHKIDFTLPKTERANWIRRVYGLRFARIEQRCAEHRLRIRVRCGDIVYITGPSGSGKTVLMNAMYDQLAPEQRIRLDQIPLPDDKPVIDCFDGPKVSAIDKLYQSILSEVFHMLQTPASLSTGQQYRFRFAKALASPAPFIFADEFACSLCTIVALSLAYKLHRLAPTTKKVFILSSVREDIMGELRPDIIIKQSLNASKQVLYKDDARDPNPQKYGAFKVKKYPY